MVLIAMPVAGFGSRSRPAVEPVNGEQGQTILNQAGFAEP
jgi:hypothetical protein